MSIVTTASGDVEGAIVEVLGRPGDDPDRARRAADLLAAVVRDNAYPLYRYLDALLAAADAGPPADAGWSRTRLVARAFAQHYAVAESVADLDASERELAALSAEVAGDPALAGLVRSTQLAVLIQRASRTGNESVLLELPRLADEFASSLPDVTGAAGLKEYLRLSVELLAAGRQGDFGTVRRVMPALQQLAASMPLDDTGRAALASGLAPVETLLTVVNDDGSLRRDPPADVPVAASDGPTAGHAAERILPLVTGLAMSEETDPTQVEEGIERIRTVLTRMRPGEPSRAWTMLALALALFRRSEVTATTAGLNEVVILLGEVRGLLTGPADPLWAMTNDLLTAVHDRVGDPRARDSAAAGRRGYVWRVLLERDPAGARSAIRDAADDAVAQARQRLSADGPADAVRMLDAGRGLMLFAAIELHRIPDRLAAAGQPDLARAWREGKPSDAMRRQAVDLLARTHGDAIFDPPTVPEIRSALSRLDADALVYLVPGSPPQPGLAVMVPADGLPAYMALPTLNLAPGTEVDSYLAALRTRGPVDRDLAPAEREGFAERLDALCGWAWRAAVGPVLESYLPRLRNRPTHREPRIVLVPVGALARVPWHAARRKDGRYAVERAAITQAASARLLCANAELAPVSAGPTGLVVGDPDTGRTAASLRSARAEAYAIREVFYPGARYVGRLPPNRLSQDRSSASGAGTADEVRRWLANTGPAAGTMLHLACHGYYAPDTGAHLLLAGDGPDAAGERRASRLGFEELVNLLARVPDRRIALVVLAACNSGRSVYGYDEAYSLGTGFLAGGVRTVLSTQWSVPDAATSMLMFLFHHYLRAEGMPPWQALRRAQVWMLDPNRQPPPEMPGELVPGPDDNPADVLAWAGFVHYGQ